MVLTDKLRRPSALVASALLLLTSLIPLLSTSKVSAAVLLGPRQIKMSSSVAGETGVTYRVKFQITTDATNVGGIVVAFCDGASSPIIGDTTCGMPAGFSLAGAGVANQTDGTQIQDDEDTGGPLNTANISAFADTAILNEDTTQLLGNTFVLTDDTPGDADPDSGDYIAFDITGVTNPSSVGTFYARIYTYETGAEALAYTLPTPDPGGNTVIDAGGIALSTAQQITVTAKVQERLTFCVYADHLDAEYNINDCDSKQGTDITLGDANGVLDPAGPFVDKRARYTITTNAAGDAVIRVKAESDDASGSLASGSFVISPIGGGLAETQGNDAAAQGLGAVEQFGFCTYEELGTGLVIDEDYDGQENLGPGTDDCSDTTQSSGTGTPSIRVDDVLPAPVDVNFAFIVSELTSTYGSIIAAKPAGPPSTGTLAFIGNIDNTTEAGIYTTVLTFIATGTY